jgi:signal transduction histidine kinase
LSITRDIVEKLGGRIDAESEVGKGTRFIITLPIVGAPFGA